MLGGENMNTTNAAAASLVIAIIMPFAATIIKQVNWSKAVNTTIVVLLCVAAGALTMWATGGFDNFKAVNLLIIISGIFVASQATYAAYWKGTATEDKLNVLTSLVTLKK